MPNLVPGRGPSLRASIRGFDVGCPGRRDRERRLLMPIDRFSRARGRRVEDEKSVRVTAEMPGLTDKDFTWNPGRPADPDWRKRNTTARRKRNYYYSGTQLLFILPRKFPTSESKPDKGQSDFLRTACSKSKCPKSRRQEQARQINIS